MNGLRLIRMFLLVGALALPAKAQDLGVTLSPIVTMDVDRLLTETMAGQSITGRLAELVQDLAAENARIASDLEAEEKALTEKRPTLEPSEFRLLADEFDRKVQQIRAEQDAKQAELQRLRDGERTSFIDAIGPLLSAIARDHGAVVILERRNVFLSADGIDITATAIERIDQALESGELIQNSATPDETDTESETD